MTPRFLHASSLCLHACAVRERRRRHRGAEQIAPTVHVNELFGLVIGVLTADISVQTRNALSHTAATHGWQRRGRCPSPSSVLV
jgi:hypothetical protein